MLLIRLTTLITHLCIISDNNTSKMRLQVGLIAILILESIIIGEVCSIDALEFDILYEKE